MTPNSLFWLKSDKFNALHLGRCQWSAILLTPYCLPKTISYPHHRTLNLKLETTPSNAICVELTLFTLLLKASSFPRLFIILTIRDRNWKRWYSCLWWRHHPRNLIVFRSISNATSSWEEVVSRVCVLWLKSEQPQSFSRLFDVIKSDWCFVLEVFLFAVSSERLWR